MAWRPERNTGSVVTCATCSTEQIALLVGIIRGPSYYDPRRNPERATGASQLRAVEDSTKPA